MDERRALLRAILAVPEDDTRRLAFADWLDENGTTDHDAARAEFIRLGCKMKDGKKPIQKVESGWLRENWKRLFPSFAAAAGDGVEEKWQGRYLTLHVLSMHSRLRAEMFVNIEFSRGFAARVRFQRAFTYRRFRDAITDDDPVTTIGPYTRPAWSGTSVNRFVMIALTSWGEDVFARVMSHDHETKTQKRFDTTPARPAHAVDSAALDALTAAMTTIAREENGLTPPLEPA